MNVTRKMGKVKKYAKRQVDDFDANDILNMLGLEKAHTSVDFVMPTLGILAAGAIVGAGIALLFAPSSGKRLRADATQKLNKKINDLKERYLPEETNIGEQRTLPTNNVNVMNRVPAASSIAR